MKKYVVVFLLFITLKTQAQEFITRWDLSYTGSSPNSITFGVGTTGNVNYTWETIPAGTTGSGTFTGNSATISGLPTGAVIRLKIDSTNFYYFKMDNGLDKNRLLDVEHWGNIAWGSMNNAFSGCAMLNISATDVPNLSNVTDMIACFAYCSQLNGPSNMNTWNVSNVTKMSELFFNDHSFNQPIGNWNVSNVTHMLNMFYGASNFNQAIGNWNTSNVVYMYDMFLGAASFNQPVGNWNVSNVISMIYMFYNATAFNQSLSNWNFNSNVNLSNMLDNSGMDCSNYSTTLNGWANNSSCPTGRNLGALSKQYGTNVVVDRNYLVGTKAWVINGDIANSSACLFGPTQIQHTFIESISLSPNPTHSSLTLSTQEAFNNATIKLLSALGQIVYEQKNIQGKQATINTAAFSNGVYFIEVKEGENMFRGKMVKD